AAMSSTVSWARPDGRASRWRRRAADLWPPAPAPAASPSQGPSESDAPDPILGQARTPAPSRLRESESHRPCASRGAEGKAGRREKETCSAGFGAAPENPASRDAYEW